VGRRCSGSAARRISERPAAPNGAGKRCLCFVSPASLGRVSSAAGEPDCCAVVPGPGRGARPPGRGAPRRPHGPAVASRRGAHTSRPCAPRRAAEVVVGQSGLRTAQEAGGGGPSGRLPSTTQAIRREPTAGDPWCWPGWSYLEQQPSVPLLYTIPPYSILQAAATASLMISLLPGGSCDPRKSLHHVHSRVRKRTKGPRGSFGGGPPWTDGYNARAGLRRLRRSHEQG
jgi:hypothetical protein